jgi:glutathionylspermidine synthase
MINTDVSFKSESLAITLSDILIFEVCLFMREELHCLPSILHELTVADQVTPSILKNWDKKTALGLTGRVDYTVITLVHPTKLAARKGK